MCIPGGQGVAGSNPAVPTVFRTPVPRNGNENGHDHSHLTGQDEQTIQADGQAIPTTRAPMAEIPARRAGQAPAFPPQPRAGLDQHARAEQLAQRRSPARAPSQPEQHSSGTKPTGHLTLTPDVRADHHPGDHGAPTARHAGPAPMASPPPRRPLRPAATAAARRMPTTYRRPPPATQSPNVASTRSDADVSRANTRR